VATVGWKVVKFAPSTVYAHQARRSSHPSPGYLVTPQRRLDPTPRHQSARKRPCTRDTPSSKPPSLPRGEHDRAAIAVSVSVRIQVAVELAYLVIQPSWLVYGNVCITDAIRPATAQRYSPINKVDCPEEPLSHVMRVRRAVVGPKSLLMETKLKTQTAGQPRNIVCGVGTIGVH